MNTNDFSDRGDRVLSPVLGHFTRLNIAYGKGSYLYTPDDVGYLDFTAGIAVAGTGHCHPKVVESISAQAGKLIHACAGVVYYENNVALAEKLGQLTGGDLSSVFFTQSGSEAVEAAIKLAKYVTKKPGILAFNGSFHGRTLGALSITTSKKKYHDGYAPLLEGMRFFDYPYAYRNPWGDTSDNFDAESVAQLEAFFDTLDNSIAAAIIEPVLGEGGYVPANTAFLKRLSELCKARGILLIFDEIQSGFYRTGPCFNYQAHGVLPDILTVAKGMGSGMPIGACISTPDLMGQWTTGAHGGTYGGNPVTCAAALATIEVLSEVKDSILERSEQVFSQLRSRLGDHKHVGDIRGSGLMVGLELVVNKASKTPNVDLLKTVMQDCLAKQLIVVSCGVHDNVLRLMPPLTISKDDLQIGIDRLIEVFDAYR